MGKLFFLIILVSCSESPDAFSLDTDADTDTDTDTDADTDTDTDTDDCPGSCQYNEIATQDLIDSEIATGIFIDRSEETYLLCDNGEEKMGFKFDDGFASYIGWIRDNSVVCPKNQYCCRPQTGEDHYCHEMGGGCVAFDTLGGGPGFCVFASNACEVL